MSDRSAREKDRQEGKRQMLVYLPADLITALKIAGVEDGTSVSRIVEEVAAAWLKRRQGRKDRKRNSGLGLGATKD